MSEVSSRICWLVGLQEKRNQGIKSDFQVFFGILEDDSAKDYVMEKIRGRVEADVEECRELSGVLNFGIWMGFPNGQR